MTDDASWQALEAMLSVAQQLAREASETAKAKNRDKDKLDVFASLIAGGQHLSRAYGIHRSLGFY